MTDAGAPATETRTHRAVLLVAALTLLFHFITARGYGIFRDELYYLANGQHLGLGYVEHPPLVGWLAALVRALLGTSLFAIRLAPAAAGGATVWLTGALARELGGRGFAQVTAALAAALCPGFLALSTILSMNAFDLMFWAALLLVVARILRRGEQRLWLVFGLVAGVGLENKISVLFLGAGLAAGLVLARRWDVLRRLHPWIGGAVALALLAPYVLWQRAHGWPLLEFMDNARRLKNVDLSPLAFLGQQVLTVNALALPLALAGLGFLLLDRAARPFRPLGWAWLAVLGIMLAAGSAKPYYLIPSYSILFAGGAVALERWSSARWRRAARTLTVGLVVVGGLVSAPLAKPILPEDAFVRYAALLGVRPSVGERKASGRLPQFFADMHGWPELAASVARVSASLGPAERARACVFAQNYGEAGAIDLFGPRLGLPPAISGHNSYYLWGPGACTGEVLIIIGGDPGEMHRLFRSLRHAATHRCVDCMPYEDNKEIWIGRGLRVPLKDLWPRLKKYI